MCGVCILYMYVSLCIHVYMCVCAYLYICVYLYVSVSVGCVCNRREGKGSPWPLKHYKALCIVLPGINC